jgi:hypothetical protein
MVVASPGGRGVDAGPDLWPACALFPMSALWRTIFLQAVVAGSGGDREPGDGSYARSAGVAPRGVPTDGVRTAGAFP